MKSPQINPDIWKIIDITDGATINYLKTKSAAVATLIIEDSDDLAALGYKDGNRAGPILRLRKFGSRKLIIES